MACMCTRGNDEYTPDSTNGCTLHEVRPFEGAKANIMKETIEIDVVEFKELLDELMHLREQVVDLQTAGSALRQLKREEDITYQVAEFHYKFGFPVRTTPVVPNEEEIRFRLLIMVEEFFETLGAIVQKGSRLRTAREVTAKVVNEMDLDVDMVELADGLADLDYVVQGTRAHFGIPRVPVAREVHRSNCEKEPSQGSGYPGIKPKKPTGWRGPDIAGELRKAGWTG